MDPLRFGRGVALLWAGVLGGATFIATPAKFLAPELSLRVALQVGQATFRMVGWAELCLALAILVCLFAWRRATIWWLVPMALFAAQRLAVMPWLDARTEAVIAGRTAPGSGMHWIYIALEFVKLIVLIGLGFGWISRAKGGVQGPAGGASL